MQLFFATSEANSSDRHKVSVSYGLGALCESYMNNNSNAHLPNALRCSKSFNARQSSRFFGSPNRYEGTRIVVVKSTLRHNR